MEIDGEEYLFYKAFPINVGIIRGTTADPDGNVTMEKEALTLEAQAIAMAATELGRHRHRPGRADRRARHAQPATGQDPRHSGRLRGGRRKARIPHADFRSNSTAPAFSGEIRVPMSAIPPMAMSERKIIVPAARRWNCRPNAVVNLGIGMPEGVANVAAEEKIARPDHADRRTRRDRRHPGRRAQLRRRGQYPGDHRPAQPVRLLRRRRPRHRLSRPGPGRPQGNLNVSKFGPAWPAPAASSTSRRAPRRWSSSVPSPPANWK
jgi:hypothetical protein